MKTNLEYFFKNRKYLFEKVCYKGYQCVDNFHMIIINIQTGVTSFLDDVSALCFQTLAEGDKKDLLEFMLKYVITEQELLEFVAELEDTGIIGKRRVLEKEKEEYNLDSDPESILDFENILFENGYLYSIHIDLTDACNLKCVHCYYPFEKCHENEISLEEIKNFINKFKELGGFVVTLSGGEPLLRNDFWDIVKYISDQGMVISIFSNGTLFDEDDIIKIQFYNIQKIGVSLYAIDESIHDKITGIKGSCKQTKSTLEKLKHLPLEIEVKCVLMKVNFEQYKTLNEYCKKNGFSLTLDTSMTPKLNGGKQPLQYSLNYQQMLKFAMDKSFNHFEDNILLNSKNFPCMAGRASLYCSHLGKVFPCVSLRIELGDMKNIIAIWKNSNKLKLWQNVILEQFSDCGKYTYCDYCNHICAGINLLENGDYLKCHSSQCLNAQAREEAYKRLQLLHFYK